MKSIQCTKKPTICVETSKTEMVYFDGTMYVQRVCH
jgi:hypothetical protein